MDRIKLHDKHFKLFIPNEKIEAAIRQTAGRINNDFRGCTEPPRRQSVRPPDASTPISAAAPSPPYS